MVESAAYHHKKAVSTTLPPAQAPPQLPARRVLQLGERGFCPGGRASWPGGMNLSAEFNATTGFRFPSRKIRKEFLFRRVRSIFRNRFVEILSVCFNPDTYLEDLIRIEIE